MRGAPSRPRGAAWWGAALGVLFLLPRPGGTQTRSAVQNLAPPHLVFIQPPAEGAEVTGAGVHAVGFDLAYASVFTSDRAGEDRALLDMELFRMGLRYAYGLVGGMEFGIEVPFLWMGAGVFDSFLIGYHDALHLPSGDREDEPRNEFRYEVEVDGDTYAPSPGGGLAPGDVTLHLKRQVATLGPVELATRVLVEVPTGDAGDGLGNGALDAGMGVLAGGRWEAVDLFGDLDVLYLGRSPDPALDLSTHWSFSAAGGMAFPVWSLGEGSAHLVYTRSPYDTGLTAFDRDAMMLAVSFERRSGAFSWSVGFTEDLGVGASPDFSLFFSLGYRRPASDSADGPDRHPWRAAIPLLDCTPEPSCP